MRLNKGAEKFKAKSLCVLFCIFCSLFYATMYAYAGGSKEPSRPAKQKAPPAPAPAESIVRPPQPAEPNKPVESGRSLLVGSDRGLFSISGSGEQQLLWPSGAVRKIIRIDSGGGAEAWAILSDKGIFVSADLQTWEERNQGLPIKTIKTFQNGKKSFFQLVQEIKDFEVNPANTDIMVCATKDRVYLSRNQGRAWTSLGAPPYRTNGIKAVAAAYMPGVAGTEGAPPQVLTVFLSHSTYGLFYIQPDRNGQWIEMGAGLEKLETTGNVDEVSDIAVVPGPGGTVVYTSQTFRRRIYRLDWSRKTFDLLWKDDSPFGTTDSLDAGKTGLRFVREGMVSEIGYAPNGGITTGGSIRDLPGIAEEIRKAAAFQEPHCAVIREESGPEAVNLCELWLLSEADPGAAGIITRNQKSAAGKEGLYLPVNHAMDPYSLRPYLELISERNLDMVVIDMKDDYGRLRFTPNNPAITEKGRVFRPLDIDALLKDFKSRGIYTAARIVVFKDPVLAAKEGGKYAVWDSRNNRPWAGYYDTRQKKGTGAPKDSRYETVILSSSDPDMEILRTFYDERWVDPYSEAVWEYTAAVAEELRSRGFDEIQFDYIRFPTDGANLADARYRWQENGMDMESAILSFMRHIHARAVAPVSIDIYGANGWYRTGARTGQEVELLAPWVDVICPMYYPSHFEQDFQAQAPAEQRPWRIYYLGTLRTARIGRGRIIVRPYVQAFYLNVSYDRKYYNSDYVRLEVEGVRAAGRPGLTYWNNSGRYEDIPK